MKGVRIAIQEPKGSKKLSLAIPLGFSASQKSRLRCCVNSFSTRADPASKTIHD